MFSEFVKEIVKELGAKETRKRARSADAQSTFSYAVGNILKELWRNALSYPRGNARLIYAAVTIPSQKDIETHS